MNNRPFKFRAWDNVYKNWVSVFELTFFNNPNYTVQQFTGLLDKNGVEIYEGDIVEKHYIGTIYYQQYSTIIRWQDEKCGFSVNKSSKHSYKIIGNVNYDNVLI